MEGSYKYHNNKDMSYLNKHLHSFPQYLESSDRAHHKKNHGE